MLAGLECQPGGLEMPIVRRGDADDIHGVERAAAELRYRGRSGEAGERGHASGGIAAIALGAAAGAAGDRGQLDLHRTEVTAIDALGMGTLEKGTIGFVEDHAEADHAGAETVRRGIHVDMILSSAAPEIG